MARLLSVNVGLPREITWRGKTIFTSVWKEPVQGRRLVRRLNIDGDAQGDLAGHGGEHRAVSASCGCGLNNREKTGRKPGHSRLRAVLMVRNRRRTPCQQ
jgi:MOSC domain-containing protein YiiM